jgi:drug/metabolite transporter (DMT)-like permease
VKHTAGTAALVVAASSLIFAVMALFAKQASLRLPGTEVAFVRFLIGLAACAAVGARGGLRANNKRGLALRGLLGGTAVLCYFLCIEHLPVGLATLLNYTAPVFTALWAAALLGERLDALSIVSLALATVGVALVSFSGMATPAQTRWIWLGALSAVISGAAVATIREVRKTDGSWEIFASFCAGGALITGGPAIRSWVAPSQREWWLLLAVGLTAVAGQMGLTWSLRYVRAATAGILQQLTPVGALTLGALVYGDRITPLAALGAAVTIAGVSFGAWHMARPAVLSEDA